MITQGSQLPFNWNPHNCRERKVPVLLVGEKCFKTFNLKAANKHQTTPGGTVSFNDHAQVRERRKKLARVSDTLLWDPENQTQKGKDQEGKQSRDLSKAQAMAPSIMARVHDHGFGLVPMGQCEAHWESTGVCGHLVSSPNSAKACTCKAPLCSPARPSMHTHTGVVLVPTEHDLPCFWQKQQNLSLHLYGVLVFHPYWQLLGCCTLCTDGFHTFLVSPRRTLCSSCIYSVRLVLDQRYSAALSCQPNSCLHPHSSDGRWAFFTNTSAILLTKRLLPPWGSIFAFLHHKLYLPPSHRLLPYPPAVTTFFPLVASDI